MVSAAGCARVCFGLSAYFAKFKLFCMKNLSAWCQQPSVGQFVSWIIQFYFLTVELNKTCGSSPLVFIVAVRHCTFSRNETCFLACDAVYLFIQCKPSDCIFSKKTFCYRRLLYVGLPCFHVLMCASMEIV